MTSVLRLWPAFLRIGLISSLTASCGDPAAHEQTSVAAAGGETGTSEKRSPGAAGEGELPEPDAPPKLGLRCLVDADCGDSGLTCLSSDQDFREGGGAPAGGLCTAACETDADCAPFDAGAVCATLEEAPLVREFARKPLPRLCMLGCALGSPGGDKCHGRAELACRPFAPEDVAQCDEDGGCPEGRLCYRDQCRKVACGPRCNDDADCSDGRVCDPISGLCSDRLELGVTIGQPCGKDFPALGSCEGGTCLELFDGGLRVGGMCTQSCTLGQPCGNGQGACVQPRLADYAIGDIAYCQELCDDTEDCSDPEATCFPFEDPDLAHHYGGLGVCEPTSSG